MLLKLARVDVLTYSKNVKFHLDQKTYKQNKDIHQFMSELQNKILVDEDDHWLLDSDTFILQSDATFNNFLSSVTSSSPYFFATAR